MGPYTNLEVVFKSEMHIDVCKVQLTQNLRMSKTTTTSRHPH